MKRLGKIIVTLLCVAALALPVLATACTTQPAELVDYAAQCKLDFTSETKKQEVKVRLYIDGDTTHFDVVEGSTLPGCDNRDDFYTVEAPTKGYAKARYIAVNTPESTIQIEPFGKAASDFTHNKLIDATSIVIESDDNQWNIDSTGERYLLWVWYKTADSEDYRNLNLEILQAGLAYNSSAAESRYGEYCMQALAQAEAAKLYIFSGEADPDYYYGGPINVDLRALRFNTEAYEGKRVIVEGVIVANFGSSAYLESTFTDIDGYGNGITIGMPVFYGYTTGKVVNDILVTGNKVSVSGVIQYYKNGGYYQITDIKPYNRYNKADPNNCNVIEEVGLDNSYKVLNPADFVSEDKTVTVNVEKVVDGVEVIDKVALSYKEAILGTSVTVENLTVNSVSTTTSEDSKSKGAMTLYCTAPDGTEITVRTEILKDEDGTVMEKKDYLNKKITVKGVIEKYIPQYDTSLTFYQVKCHRADYITVLN